MAKPEQKKTFLSDPVESSKMPVPGAPDAPEAAPAEEAAPVAQAPAEAAQKAPPEPVKVPKYEVQHTTTISLNGVLVTFKAGQHISADHHGPQAVQRIKDAGVPLKELP